MQPSNETVVLVVPCYNEAARLAAEPFLDLVSRHADFRIVFVNDGSTDETLGAIERIVREAPDRFVAVDLQPNRGKAEAVRAGMLWALSNTAARYVGYWDADLATPLDEAPGFADFLDRHAACQAVFGSRVQLLGRRIERSALRHYLGRVCATVASSLVLRVPVYDTQCGAKLFRVSDRLRAVFDEPFVSRWVFDVEILARLIGAAREHASQLVYEMPLRTWTDVPGSKVRARDFFYSLRDLAKIHRRLTVGAPDARSGRTPRSPRIWALGTLLVLLALIPRVWVLERDSVDADELFSRRIAVLPVADGLELVRYDVVHPPLYYGVLHVAMDLLGDGGVPMRLPSLIAGMAIVALAIAFGARATGSTGAAFLAGGLVAVSQQQIFYSAHARSYALYALLVFLLFGACVYACREPQQRSRWVIFAAACAVATLTHYLASFYVLVTLPVALIRRRWRVLISWSLAAAAAAVLSLVWVAMVIPYLRTKGGLGENLDWVGAPGLYDLISTYAIFNGLPEIPRGTTISLLLGLFLIASAAHALARAVRRGDRRGDWILLAIGGALVPPFLSFFVSSPPFNAPVWGYRHLHPSQACWAIAAAAGAWHCFGHNGRWRAAASTAALALAVSGLPEVFVYPLHEPFARVAARLAEPPLDDLPVLAVNANVATPVAFYQQEQGRDPVRMISPETRGADLPERFVLVYRKEDRRDLARIETLSAQLASRDAKLREMETIMRKPDDPWGTTIAVVEPAATH